MQTLPELLNKILDLVEDARKAGIDPRVINLSPADERTLQVQLWQEFFEVGSHLARSQSPPDIRQVIKNGDLLAGLIVQWDSPQGRPFRETSVRGLTQAETDVVEEASRLAAPPFGIEDVRAAIAQGHGDPLGARLAVTPDGHVYLHAFPGDLRIPNVAAQTNSLGLDKIGPEAAKDEKHVRTLHETLRRGWVLHAQHQTTRSVEQVYAQSELPAPKSP